MNYTDQELQISNKSYTNKDFNTIYPELLDTVKKLTNKWDPTTSNESDPGVVLLKLWAILADKLNYNIDKNILETFPLSVTQRANAQKLYDMLGYNMHYYVSATTQIGLWYVGDAFTNGNIKSITIPKFTMITNDSGSNVFTLLRDISFKSKSVPEYANVIQGTIHDYEVNGITDITLDNLDSEYRLFFTESRIAENGIFIANKGLGVLDFTGWQRVDNLEAATLNNKVYKFGVLPNTQSCYIQFPQDIGKLIGNGLKIKYIISDGMNGNIQRNQLNSFKSEIIPHEFKDESVESSQFYNSSINNDVIIKNIYASNNGADPEDLDSAYKNYKKTIGTFNTLVTTRDYENAIYNLNDGISPFCSNVVVSDRTNDINNSTNVVTSVGGQVETKLDIKKDGNAPRMTAFDLGLYILAPTNGEMDKEGISYNKSFSVISESNLKDIMEQLGGEGSSYYKSASHDFITMDANDIYLFKNFYTLTGRVITYYKVTKEEAKEIEENIKLALFRDYNSRNLEFGAPIRYEDIVKTIETADTRIKSLILNEPEYKLRYMLPNDYSGDYNSSKDLTWDQKKDLLKRMILGGNVQLYKFNEDVAFDFGQTDIVLYDNITKITTSFKKDMSAFTGEGYTIGENETFQIYAPNFYTKTIYSSYVNYALSDDLEIPQNTYYQLKEGEEIAISYTKSDGTPGDTTIAQGDIVKYSGPSGNLSGEGSLDSTQKIEVMDINQVTFPKENSSQRTLYCMWFTNRYKKEDDGSYTYVLFNKDEPQYILQDNEYFIYTNSDKNELVILGSGTMLVRSGDSGELSHKINIPKNKILTEGQAAIEDNVWYKYNLTETKTLSLVEMQIVSLGKGAVVKFTENTDASEFNANTSYELTSISYKANSNDGIFTPLTSYELTSTQEDPFYRGWSIIGRYNLAMSPISSQLLPNGVSINIYYKAIVDGEEKINSEEISGNNNIKLFSNSILTLNGGENLPVQNLDGSAIKIYKYTNVDTPKNYAKEGIEFAREGDYITINYKDWIEDRGATGNSIDDDKFYFNFSNGGSNNVIIKVEFVGDSTTATITQLNSLDLPDDTKVTTLGGEGDDIKKSAFIEFDPNSYKGFRLTWETIEGKTGEIRDIIKIGAPKIIKSDDKYSEQLKTTWNKNKPSTNTDTIDAFINDGTNGIIKCYPNFDLTYKVPVEDLIEGKVGPSENYNDLFAGDLLWDKNHICNKYVIPQYNFEDSSHKISIAPHMIKD